MFCFGLFDFEKHRLLFRLFGAEYDGSDGLEKEVFLSDDFFLGLSCSDDFFLTVLDSGNFQNEFRATMTLLCREAQ